MGEQINNIRIMNRMYLHYFSVLFLIPSIMGHGNMIRPRTWWNPEGWDGNHVGCGVLDLPDTEFEHHNDHIVDMVHVPSTLEPGQYVLSFRWDSKCSPQVWTSCANIEILS